jgi:hypothetical protein
MIETNVYHPKGKIRKGISLKRPVNGTQLEAETKHTV